MDETKATEPLIEKVLVAGPAPNLWRMMAKSGALFGVLWSSVMGLLLLSFFSWETVLRLRFLLLTVGIWTLTSLVHPA